MILVGNMGANSITLAKTCMLSVRPEQASGDMVKFLAITTLTIVCLTHYFSRRFSIVLNNILATFKIGLLVIIIVFGFIASKRSINGRADWNSPPYPRDKPKDIPKDYFTAFLLVMYSYQGWNNANFVSVFGVSKAQYSFGANNLLGHSRQFSLKAKFQVRISGCNISRCSIVYSSGDRICRCPPLI